MKLKITILTVAAAIWALAGLEACKEMKDVVPSADFAPYVSAFTGGVVPAGSNVTVKLTGDLTDEARKDLQSKKLFSFEPALKGELRLADARTIEFVPEAGALKSGTLYNATFALGKVMDVDKRFARFDFSFRVEERTFKLVAKPVEIQLDNTVLVRGELHFSDMIQLAAVEMMISAAVEGKAYDVAIEGQNNARVFRFAVGGIARTGDNRQLIIAIDGVPGGIDRKETVSINIPAADKFHLIDHQIVTSPDYGLNITFSDLIDDSQPLKSMITLKNIPDYKIQVRGNQVMVYFTPATELTEITAVIDRGLKNAAGENLGETKEFTLSLEALKPRVELLTSGAILPTSDRVVLPFRAVALHAVDLRIIRIFENNVLMFLQNNSLGDNQYTQLRRAGRLIYKTTLRLDGDPAKNIKSWENYSLDLSGLVKQRPGDIYRIELSFKQAYAAYDCDDEDARESALNGAVDIATAIVSDELTDADENYWDTADSYYYDNYGLEVDWNEYDWQEIGNPCNPTYYMQSDKKASTNVYVSNLGMIAKGNANNTFWVAVTNILDTKPVVGANVVAYSYQLQPIGKASTDENGFAVLNLNGRPYIIVAESGRQKAYLNVQDGSENLLSRFDVGGVLLKKGLKGYVYGERGVWRPGDAVHLAFMLEDREDAIPDGHPVSLEIYNPQGQFYKKMISTSGLNGLYTFTVPTKADDPTGLWNAYIKVGGATFHKTLRIETVQPNRLKINLDLPDIIDASKTTAVSAAIHAQWLTGATARNLAAKMELVLSRVTTQFKGYEKYTFNNPATQFTLSRTEVFDGRLNDLGDARFEMPLPAAANAPGMLNANITCRVFEAGGNASIFTKAVPFSPYSSYVGINLNNSGKDGYLFTDEDNVFDIITLDRDGKPLNRKNLEYFVYKIGWSWWWENDNESFGVYINNTNYKPLYTGRLHTTDGKGQIKFRVNYPDWGRFLVYVKDTDSGHATGGAVLVDWPSWRGRSNKDDPTGIKMLTFSLDKESYLVGDEVLVTIPKVASEGRALVAIENGSEVLRREWVNLTAGSDTKYLFKATEDMAPNVYVHISLLQPHASAGDLPIRMYGVAPVFVSNKNSVLTPVISVADVLRPETEFEVKVKEQSGKPMTYTLAIVDDGLLDLTNFKTPDPWNEFYAREALGIRTWDLFDNVMGAFAGKYGSLFSIGGDMELKRSSSDKANRFKPVVIYVGPVALKAGGEQKHSLKLPPYVGSVRVMVVAGQDGAYGKADKTVPVRTPLMLLSSLPRVLSTGEKISLPVNVFAMENTVKDVTIKVETTGKLSLAEGVASRSITFDTPGDRIVYFPIQTGSVTGKETVKITASGGGRTSTETVEIDIRNPNPPTITFAEKILEKGASTEFDYTLDADYEGNWVKVEMSRIPTVDISRRFDYLYDYNNYCTEQLTSQALPLLYLSDFKTIDGREAELIKKNITGAIDNLYGRQLANGGFCYWPGQGYVNDWITTYAGSFLIIAKERGYNVNNQVINRWIDFQRTTAQNWKTANVIDSRYTYNQSDIMQAYRLYSLALAGAPEMGAMNRLKEVKDMSLQARWRLAAAYALAGKQDAANELIFNASTVVTPYSSNNPSYGSSTRDEAMILEALTLTGRIEEAFRLAQKISKSLSGERFFDTQTTAYAMVAMGQLAAKMSGRLDFEWFIDGKKQDKVATDKAIFQKQLPPKPLSGKVKVVNSGDGQLYFSLATKTRPIVDNQPATSENIRLTVSYTDLNGARIDVADLKQGAEFFANVEVSNVSGHENYNDVALTHIIPSGWEIFNDRMVAASTADAIGNAAPSPQTDITYQNILDDRVLTYFDLPIASSKTIKIRLQATYVGDFVFPAIQCEAMYNPSARARTAAGKAIVRQ
ncbi:MAG: alpha-2-macroglobulin [Tannerella sp.]|nr:alpha-2-macroglobulin [Tannerella sp.]